MDSKDGYDQAVNDWQNNWEASTTKGYYTQTHGGTISKGQSTTQIGQSQAASVKNDFKNGNENLNDYKYGYVQSHVTNNADGSINTTVDSYFWN